MRSTRIMFLPCCVFVSPNNMSDTQRKSLYILLLWPHSIQDHRKSKKGNLPDAIPSLCSHSVHLTSLGVSYRSACIVDRKPASLAISTTYKNKNVSASQTNTDYHSPALSIIILSKPSHEMTYAVRLVQ